MEKWQDLVLIQSANSGLGRLYDRNLYFFIFFQTLANFASASLRKGKTEANFCHLLAFANPVTSQKF